MEKNENETEHHWEERYRHPSDLSIAIKGLLNALTVIAWIFAINLVLATVGHIIILANGKTWLKWFTLWM
ncbi:MAG: hypothetical protein FWG26_10420 [Betaproteobacteria bacterium]|nr:hypothetical protein [Betaproteobacteria bacterium]